MNIVFNTSSSLNDTGGEKYFLAELFKKIIPGHPDDRFIILCPDLPSDGVFRQQNVTLITTGPARLHPLLKKAWFDIRLPSILKKYKADVFVSDDAFCSVTVKLPQYLLLHQFTLQRHAFRPSKAAQFFQRRWLPRFLHKASGIIVSLPSLKKILLEDQTLAADKIDVVYPAAKDIFKSVGENIRDETKRKYSGGKNYFLCSARGNSANSLLNFLKAFSVFKKRQKSDWKFLIEGELTSESKAFRKLLDSYRYRDDVSLTGIITEDERACLTGSAYAVVYAGRPDSMGSGMLEALNSGVPAITGEGLLEGLVGDAVLYADFNDHAAIADKMMLLYKDESLRMRLVEKAKSAVERFTWDNTAVLFWQSIEKGVTVRQ